MTLAVRHDGSYFRSALAEDIEPRGKERILTASDFNELLPLSQAPRRWPRAMTGMSDPAESVTTPSATYIHNPQDHVKARFRMLRHLPASYDGQGASAPNAKSIDMAIDFVDRIRSGPNFTATLDDDGSAVIEFEDRGTTFFADITFRDNGTVEMYKREGGSSSEFFEGQLFSAEGRRFLESFLELVL